MKNKTGIFVNGSIKSAGVTFFTRHGQTIIRSAISNQPKRRTLGQFNVRERRAHVNSLWHDLRECCAPLLTGGRAPYYLFCSLAAKLPTLYLTREEHTRGYTLLMPGIPVSCGTLPDVGYRLGTVDGRPALLTDLPPALVGDDTLTLVTLTQCDNGGLPRLDASATDLVLGDCTLVDGRLALVGDGYGDSDCGWALVRRRRSLCSTQCVVTAATAYQTYRTDVALQRAAASYGGLT